MHIGFLKEKVTQVDVVIIVGSRSDIESRAGKPPTPFEESKICDFFDKCGIGYVVSVFSTHRHPHPLDDFMRQVVDHRPVAVIAAAGLQAGLPGAAQGLIFEHGAFNIPVVAVALSSKNAPDAYDSLAATTRMPPGVPVLCAGVDAEGWKNAAIALALMVGRDPDRYRQISTTMVVDRSQKLPEICVLTNRAAPSSDDDFMVPGSEAGGE